MNAATPWLPPGTSYARVEQRIVETVRGWSCAWFGDTRVGTNSIEARSKAATLPHELRACGGEAWLAVPTEVTSRVGHQALDLDRDIARHAADLPVLEAVGNDAIEDLQDRLTQMLGVQPDHQPDADPAAAFHRWAISWPGCDAPLTFMISAAQRARLLLDLLPPPPAPYPLAEGSAALAPVGLDLAATLGICDLTVAELRTLAPGDVLLFDHALSAPLPLLIDGSRSARGACSVTRDAERLNLLITEPPHGNAL